MTQAGRRIHGVAALSAAPTPAAMALAVDRAAEPFSVGLRVETETIPFFIAMREASSERARKRGATLSVGTRRTDGDDEGQLATVATMIGAGLKGIPADDGSAPASWLERAVKQGVGLASFGGEVAPGVGTPCSSPTRSLESSAEALRRTA